MNYYVSFDYSITSPSMCVYDGKKYILFALTSTQKHVKVQTEGNFTFIIEKYPEYKSPQERYHKLAHHFISKLDEMNIEKAEFGIEDYAFAAKGKVFHIAENTQCLKGIIYNRYQKEMLMMSPNSLKKLFSGKGNASKDQMAEAFIEKVHFDIAKLLGAPKNTHPTDMVDAYAVNNVLYDISTGKINPSILKK